MTLRDTAITHVCVCGRVTPDIRWTTPNVLPAPTLPSPPLGALRAATPRCSLSLPYFRAVPQTLSGTQGRQHCGRQRGERKGVATGADSDSDDGETGSACGSASPRASGAAPAASFLDSTGACATHLRISDQFEPSYSDEDEQLPGESDDDDEGFRGRFGSARRRRSKSRKKNHRRIVISMLSSKYEVVAQAARAMGWKRAVDENEEYNLLWADSYIPFDSIASLNRYQKVGDANGSGDAGATDAPPRCVHLTSSSLLEWGRKGEAGVRALCAGRGG